MKFLLRFTISTFVHSPARLFLTLLAMIISSAFVAWMVAGFDTILSEDDKDFIQLTGNYDCLATWPKKITLSQKQRTALQKMLQDPRIKSAAFCTSLEVNCSLVPNRFQRKSKNNPAPQKRGKSLNLPSPKNKHSDSMESGIAPPTHGLPIRSCNLISTNSTCPTRPIIDGYGLNSQGAKYLSQKNPKAIPCLIDEKIAQYHATPLGAVFQVGSVAGTYSMILVGILKNAPTLPGQRNASSDSEYCFPGIQEIWIDSHSMKKIIAVDNQPRYLFLSFQQGEKSATAFLEDWQPCLQSMDIQLFDAERLSAFFAQKNSHNHFKSQAYSVTGITMLAAFFIIFTSLSMGIHERTRQLAILRAVAFSRRQLAGTVLLEGFLLGLIGWLGGLLLCRFSIIFFPSMPSKFQTLEMHIGYWTILLTGICAIAGALLASLYPAWMAGKVKPIEAAQQQINHALSKKKLFWLCFCGLICLTINPVIIFYPELKEMTRIRLYGFLGCPTTVIGFLLLLPICYVVCEKLATPILARLFCLPQHLLQAQLTADTWKSIGTAISLSIGLGLYMSALIWSASMLKPFLPGKWMPEYFAAMTPGGFAQEDIAKIRAIPGIDANYCQPVAVEQVRLAEDITGSKQHKSCVRQNNVIFFGVDPMHAYTGKDPLYKVDFIAGDPNDVQKLLLDKNANYCIIPQHFAIAAKLHLYDTFTVIPPDSPQSPVTYKIAGIIDFKGWHWFSKFAGIRRSIGRTAAIIFASEKNIRRNFNLDRLEYFAANLTPAADVKLIQNELAKIAKANRGQIYHMPGKGDTKIDYIHFNINTKKNLTQSILRRTESFVKGMLKLPFVILLICSLAVMNTTIANIQSRRREIGIMRAVGINRGTLSRLIMTEAIQIGLTAAVISIAYGIFSGLCNAQMATHISFFGGLGWNFALPLAGILRGFCFTILLSWGAATIPAIVCAYTSPLKLLEK